MIVNLHFRSDFFELVTDHRKIVFTTEDIKVIQIEKRFNTLLIVCYFLVTMFLYVVFTKLCYLPFLLFVIFMVPFLIFLTIIYKPIYQIQLHISHEHFFIETTNKELHLDFVMLNYFHAHGNE